ncbi:MAG: FAD:protein FMN transferase [Candidatus Cryptobacteroides sp.]
MALSLLFVACAPKEGYISITGYAQGGTYTVKLNMDGPQGRVAVAPEAIKASIDSVLLAIDNSVSGYNRSSLLSKFNAGEPVAPDLIFRELYDISYKFYEFTGGAFDVAAGPLFDAWGFGFKGNGFPTDQEVEDLRENCGMDALCGTLEEALDGDGILEPGRLLKREIPSPVLNFNAIAQGYSADLVARHLYSIGVKDMLVDIGGEIFCDGVNPDGKPWRLGIDRPVDGNDTPGADLQETFSTGGGPCGIVTSGNYRKFYVKDGKKYAHTVDPRTGYPVSHSLLSATVIAADATSADAVATYCMVIGTEDAKRFLETDPDYEGYLIYACGDSLCCWKSSGSQALPVKGN